MFHEYQLQYSARLVEMQLCSTRTTCTWTMLINSQAGLFDVSNGYQALYNKMRSPHVKIRKVFWVMWIKIAVYMIRATAVWIRGIQATIVKEPVSGSVVGKSSQMNASVSLSTRTIASPRNLWHRTVIHHIGVASLSSLLESKKHI